MDLQPDFEQLILNKRAAQSAISNKSMPA